MCTVSSNWNRWESCTSSAVKNMHNLVWVQQFEGKWIHLLTLLRNSSVRWAMHLEKTNRLALAPAAGYLEIILFIGIQNLLKLYLSWVWLDSYSCHCGSCLTVPQPLRLSQAYSWCDQRLPFPVFYTCNPTVAWHVTARAHPQPPAKHTGSELKNFTRIAAILLWWYTVFLRNIHNYVKLVLEMLSCMYQDELAGHFRMHPA